MVSFSTEKLTKSKCQVSLAVKYSLFKFGQTLDKFVLIPCPDVRCVYRTYGSLA